MVSLTVASATSQAINADYRNVLASSQKPPTSSSDITPILLGSSIIKLELEDLAEILLFAL